MQSCTRCPQNARREDPSNRGGGDVLVPTSQGTPILPYRGTLRFGGGVGGTRVVYRGPSVSIGPEDVCRGPECRIPGRSHGLLGSWGAVRSLGSQAPLSKDPRVARVGGTGLRHVLCACLNVRYVPSACGPRVAAHPAVFWLAGTVGFALLCGADRLVTMAEGNTILYGSQTAPAATWTRRALPRRNNSAQATRRRREAARGCGRQQRVRWRWSPWEAHDSQCSGCLPAPCSTQPHKPRRHIFLGELLVA